MVREFQWRGKGEIKNLIVGTVATKEFSTSSTMMSSGKKSEFRPTTQASFTGRIKHPLFIPLRQKLHLKPHGYNLVSYFLSNEKKKGIRSGGGEGGQECVVLEVECVFFNNQLTKNSQNVIFFRTHIKKHPICIHDSTPHLWDKNT